MRWLERHDSLSVIVALVDEPDQPPREALILDLREAPVAESADELVDRLIDALSADEGVPPPFDLQVTHSVLSWGASGAGLNILLKVVSAVAGTAGWDLLKSTLRELKQRAAERSPWVEHPLSRAEALWRAKWFLGHTYGINPDGLEVVEEEEELADDGGSTWRFRLSAQGGELSADVVEEHGLVRITRHRMSRG